MQPGRVSIVIATYNDDPEHLAEAVVSAQNQSYRDVEVVIVDDGSTVPVHMPGATVIRQDNAGPHAARNAGIRVASGEWILPLDGDDWLEPDSVSLLVEGLEAAHDIVGAFPKVLRFGAGEGVQHAPSEVYLRDLAVSNQVVATTLYRRADWESVGGYDQQDDAPEDWVLWVKMLARGGRMVQVPEAVLHYRLRAGSLNTRYTDPEAGLRRIAEALPERLDDLYVAAAREAQRLRVEVAQLREFRNAWAPRVAPLLRLKSLLPARQVERVTKAARHLVGPEH